MIGISSKGQFKPIVFISVVINNHVVLRNIVLIRKHHWSIEYNKTFLFN